MKTFARVTLDENKTFLQTSSLDAQHDFVRPLFVCFSDCQSTNLGSRGGIEPKKWNDEFVFGAKRSSDLAIKLLCSSSRFSSHSFEIDTSIVSLSSLEVNKMIDKEVAIGTDGKVFFMIRVCSPQYELEGQEDDCAISSSDRPVLDYGITRIDDSFESIKRRNKFEVGKSEIQGNGGGSKEGKVSANNEEETNGAEGGGQDSIEGGKGAKRGKNLFNWIEASGRDVFDPFSQFVEEKREDDRKEEEIEEEESEEDEEEPKMEENDVPANIAKRRTLPKPIVTKFGRSSTVERIDMPSVGRRRLVEGEREEEKKEEGNNMKKCLDEEEKRVDKGGSNFSSLGGEASHKSREKERKSLQESPLASLKVKLPRLRIHLERYWYYPGQTVRGTMAYAIRRAKRMKSLRITFEGFTHVQWTDFDSLAAPMQYEKSVYFLNKTALVFGGLERHERERIEPNLAGSPLVSFAYTLPLNLPPSAHYNSRNYIAYFVTVFAHIEGQYRHKIISLPFFVFSHPLSAPIPSYPSSPSFSNREKWNSGFELSSLSPETIFLGEIFRLGFKVDSSASIKQKMVDTIVVKLKSINSRYATCGGEWRRRVKVETICKWIFGSTPTSSDLPSIPKDYNDAKHFFYRQDRKMRFCLSDILPILCFETVSSVLQLPLPEICLPTLHVRSSPLMQIYYYLTVSIRTSGGSISKRKNVLAKTGSPVIVMSRRPRIGLSSNSFIKPSALETKMKLMKEERRKLQNFFFEPNSFHSIRVCRHHQNRRRSRDEYEPIRDGAVPVLRRDGRGVEFYGKIAKLGVLDHNAIGTSHTPTQSTSIDWKYAMGYMSYLTRGERWRMGEVPKWALSSFRSFPSSTPLMLMLNPSHLIVHVSDHHSNRKSQDNHSTGI